MVVKPYEGQKFAAVFVLPKDTGADEANRAKALNHARVKFAQLFQHNNPPALQHKKVKLSVPRFKMDEKVVDMKEKLQEIGVNSAFRDGADFKKIVDGFVINQVVHCATVEVNEEGSEATAATAVGCVFRSCAAAAPTPPKVRLDRPFLFSIVANDPAKTIPDLPAWNWKTPLFLGQIVEPDVESCVKDSDQLEVEELPQVASGLATADTDGPGDRPFFYRSLNPFGV